MSFAFMKLDGNHSEFLRFYWKIKSLAWT